MNNNRVRVVFIIAISMLVVLSVISYLRIDGLLQKSAMVNHTSVVRLKLENIFSTLKDVESGQRGYLLTRNAAFVKQSNNAIRSINSQIEELAELTSDNREQQRNIDTLKNIIDERVDYMNEMVDDAKNQHFISEKLMLGKAIMDRLRLHINKMTEEENELLRDRNRILSEGMALNPFFAVLLVLFSVLIIVVSYFTIIRELKTSNQLKEKLLQNNFSLDQKNTSLVKMNKELESFNYISSHDLQEPLRKIQTFISRVADEESENLTEKGQNYLERAQMAANRLQNLVKDLLAYSRINVEEIKLQQLSLASMIDKIREELEEEILEKKATIVVTGSDELVANASQFHQLLTNLIYNSIKFSRPGIPAMIEIGNNPVTANEAELPMIPGKKYNRITVKDNGIGFEPEFNEKIFELFQRLHTKDAYPGTGIGLAIVKKIVENHQGFVSVSSETGSGTTFTFLIPA